LTGAYNRHLLYGAVPANLATVTAGSYPEFLAARRKLIAGFIRTYFDQL
jgi:hypothetical protein